MENFKMKFLEINKRQAKVIVTHNVFGIQHYDVDELSTFCRNGIIGARIKKQDIYIKLRDVISVDCDGNIYTINSPMKKIEVIVK